MEIVQMSAAGSATPARCRNTNCEHHKRGGTGCRLLEGLNFVRCKRMSP